MTARFRPTSTPSWQPSAAAIHAIVEGRHGDPFAILGPHSGPIGATGIAAFLPHAQHVQVVDANTGEVLARLEKLHEHGFFFGVLPDRAPLAYRLELSCGSSSWQIEDPYRFPSRLGDLDKYLIAEGSHRRLYERMGAHTTEIDGVAGVLFALWAPNASRVSVVGSFNAWDGRRHPMRKHPGVGVWELFIPGVEDGALYKYELLDASGVLLPLKADPLAFAQETPPATASRVQKLRRHEWSDGEWMTQRKDAQSRSAPISIYEIHLGSWRRGEHNAFLSYDRLADELIPYVKDLGFTHIELLPITEHPFAGSWGYQPIGLFAPTARFGSPDGFARFVDRFHAAGIGVLCDWVPGHFPNDAHGLARFDGTALYEHEDPRSGVHKDWNTLIYNSGRREVANFLQSSALFWLERYHIDGLRVDAVASMLYLDYSRKRGEWIPNRFGGRENLEAIAFLQGLNKRVYGDQPGTITIAEESTDWPQVSRPVESGGLGFGYKWNMGWMHDTLAYIAQDPIHRRYHNKKLTFGFVYAWDENFILPLSHDEVVHGKKSLLGKMPGDRWQKFANLRAYLAFMWTYPGKKLLFMGGEFGQEREWRHDYSLDWHLLADPAHRGIQQLVRDLNATYRGIRAMHELDCERDGFLWIDGNAEDSTLAYVRKGRGDAPPALVVCNFTPVVRHDHRFGAPLAGRWIERLNTDAALYGGSNVGNLGGVQAERRSHHGQPYSVRLTLPPLAVLVLVHDGANGAPQ